MNVELTTLDLQLLDAGLAELIKRGYDEKPYVAPGTIMALRYRLLDLLGKEDA